MSAPALTRGEPSLRIGRTDYPVLLPRLADPRLHVAAVLLSLQVLGQVAFGFELSIAQILVAVGTCAVLETGIAFRQRRVLLWPASALLTGNGVAFVLRVPDTEHGDWWSLNGWWIFAGTAALALASKYVFRFRGRHVFNPSNIGLVVCFLLLGPGRADPLALWWGPLDVWLVLALVIIVAGGIALLLRLGLIWLAASFWLVFAGGAAVLALAGHELTARWHLGPISGTELWKVLVFSPEILVFLFFMLTDPRTVPEGTMARVGFGSAVALLAVLLIAPLTTEFSTKVSVLAALVLACATRPALALLAATTRARRARARLRSLPYPLGVASLLTGSMLLGALVFVVGGSARSGAAFAWEPVGPSSGLPRVSVASSSGVSSIDEALARRLARDVMEDLRLEAEALRLLDARRAGEAALGAHLQVLRGRIAAGADSPVVVPERRVERVTVWLLPGPGQSQPVLLARLHGTEVLVTYAGSQAEPASRSRPRPLDDTLELRLEGGRYRIARVSEGDP